MAHNVYDNSGNMFYSIRHEHTDFQNKRNNYWVSCIAAEHDSPSKLRRSHSEKGKLMLLSPLGSATTLMLFTLLRRQGYVSVTVCTLLMTILALASRPNETLGCYWGTRASRHRGFADQVMQSGPNSDIQSESFTRSALVPDCDVQCINCRSGRASAYFTTT